MDLSSGEISTLVFKRVLRDDLGDFSLDRQMLAVFMELDGKTNLGAAAQRIGLNMSSMREVISRLTELKLIEKVEQQELFVDNDFVAYLVMQFSLAVGPVADVLIEDEVHNFGYELSRFPSQRVAELVDRLSREIRREEKKAAFKRKMINKIREKGYFNT
jgi:DNA-binding transcriptional ArsR family regulator